MKHPSHEDEIHDIWTLLAHTYRLIGKLWNKELSEYGFSREQGLVLLTVKALGNNATPYRISRFQVQEHNTVSDIINRMVKKGLVTKIHESTGKSRVKVKLTKSGQQALQQSLKRDTLMSIIGALPKNKLEQLKSCLEILRDRALSEICESQEWPEIRILPSQWVPSGQIGQAVKDNANDATVGKYDNPESTSD